MSPGGWECFGVFGSDRSLRPGGKFRTAAIELGGAIDRDQRNTLTASGWATRRTDLRLRRCWNKSLPATWLISSATVSCWTRSLDSIYPQVLCGKWNLVEELLVDAFHRFLRLSFTVCAAKLDGAAHAESALQWQRPIRWQNFLVGSYFQIAAGCDVALEAVAGHRGLLPAASGCGCLTDAARPRDEVVLRLSLSFAPYGLGCPAPYDHLAARRQIAIG